MAGAAGKQIKKTVLELGGSDPFIVMPSADLDAAVADGGEGAHHQQRPVLHRRQALHRRRARSPTSSSAASWQAMEALVVGDPMDPATDVGPLANEDQVTDLDDQVAAVGRGRARVSDRRPAARPARLLLRARRCSTDIPPDSPAYREEMFGPVALLFRVRDIDDAIGIANDYAASGWAPAPGPPTRRSSERFIDELEAGMVFINAMVASDPRLPFGGVKQSGYGRELGAYGIREFVNIKTVWIQDAAQESESGRLTRAE